MKTLTTIILAMLVSIVAIAQDYELIPLKEITEIANRNAEALWGEVSAAEPIAYYGQDDEIIAWRINYAIGKPFPPADKLQQICRDYQSSGDKYMQWGGDDYAQILIGARDNMPVLLEYSRSLSSEYALGFIQDEMQQKAFMNEAVSQGKIYYLNHFNQWIEISNGRETKFICLSPTGGVMNAESFEKKKLSEVMFCETGDYSKLWKSFKNGYLAATDGDKYIDYHADVPYYDWSYGCSPTAATMVFAYYDNRSSHHENKYPCFITNHFQRYDTLDKPDYSSHWDYNVSGLQKSLALGMSTDTLTGSTMLSNIDNGMRFVANSTIGYSFDIVNRYTLLWTRIKDDINSSKPLVVSIPGHSTTGVGYNDGTDMVITHYTWSPPNHHVNVSRWSVDMITRVSPGGAKGSSIKIERPYGDPRYNNDGEGEIFRTGGYEEIKWNSDEVEGGWVNLIYSTDGGHNYNLIMEETENDGVFDWLVPEGINSADCRVVAYLYDPALYPYYAGGDGSWGNFKIYPGGSLATMSNGQLYSDEEITGYYHLQHSDPSWYVVGSHTDSLGCYWQLQLFENDEFNQEPMLQYAYGRKTNFIVIDGNHASDDVRGIKHTPYGCPKENFIQYEGGNDNLTLTPGETMQINWNENQVVEMYDIHLTPGQYYFRAKRISGDMDVNIAFFSSTDDDYFKDISQADYISDNWGGVEDSFIVDITEEDDYGFCIYANERGTGMFSLKIDNAFIWTGDEDTNWHNGDNWVGGAVPLWDSDVAIPNRANDPNIYTAEAQCGTLNLLSGARLTLTNYNLEIQDDLNLGGTIEVDNPSLDIFCGGDVEFSSDGHLDLIDNSELWVEGDWSFTEGCYSNQTHGTVKFWGTENSIIYVKSADCQFNNLRISKSGGAFVAYDNCPGLEPLKVHGQFIIDDGATFIQYAMYNTIFEGPFLAYAGSHFAFTSGTAIFDYSGTGGVSINSEPGSYFNNLTASCADWLGLSSDIDIRGDLTIEEGNFKTLGYDVYIKGDWNDEAWGFNHGSSRVIFTGSGIQESYGGAFWELELNKSGGELRIRENTTGVQHYDWTQGTLRVNGGYFLANDLEDAGLYGTVIVTSGTADFRQDPGQYFDMNADLEISGGELHLHGGNGMGYWPFSNDASITMSDGLIDVHDNGIRIYNSASYTLDEDISGGLIRINGSLQLDRDDFNPTGGTIQLIGYEEDESLHSVEGANLFNLNVDKSSKKNKAIAANLVATGYVDINGDFTLDGGNFEAPETLVIYGQFINNQTPDHFDELTGEVVFDGPEDNVMDEDEVFHDLTIKKPSDYFIVSENVSLGVNGAFTVDEGTAYFLPGSEITVGSSIAVNYGGTLALEGTATDQVSVNNGISKVNYSFDVNPGGTIGAVHTIFIYMNTAGLNLHSGAYVIPEGAFHHCNFAYGSPGGTLMTIDNGADLVIHEANFLPNTTGMANNVTKNVDNGNVFFDGAMGDFSGEAFEDDPYNRIHWEYVPPFELPFTEDWSSADFETNIWTPTGANWGIDNAYGNELPSARFGFSPTATDYHIQLRSYQLNGIPHDQISLSYDIAFEAFATTTLEQMSVRVVYPNGDFYTVANYTNEAGSFDFISKEIDISEYAAGETFMISFMAHGEDSWNIEKWNIDNIEVLGMEALPGKLSGNVKEESTGIPIENALVEILGTTFSMLTDEIGEFNIVDVPPGFYNVRTSADGFQTKDINGVEIKSEENTNITIVLSPLPPSYCTLDLYQFGCTEGDGINTFILEDIVNEASGCSTNGYGDFTFMSTGLSRGYPYPLQLSSNYSDQYVSVWVDVNDDFEFDETERLITDLILENSGEIYTGILNVPESAPLGTHRLRVRSNWNSSCVDPCAYYSYGEAEDYTISVNNEPALGGLKMLVSDGQNKGPVENARVEVVGTNWFGYTEEEGYCMIEFIDAGIYDILITADGYEDLTIIDQCIFPQQMMELSASIVPLLPQIQSINLTAGWQGLSSFLMPSNNNIQDIFSPVMNELVLVYDFDEVFWPAAGVTTLKNWDHHDAFFLKVNNDIVLEIAGFPETDMSCELAQGWTLLPVICSESISLAGLLDGTSALENLVMIKEIAGTGIFWPEFEVHSLEVLEKGKAYLVCMEQSDQIVFPEIASKSDNVPNQFEYPVTGRWNVPAKTASSHIVMFPEPALNHLDVDENCWMAAFTAEGLCCGMAPIKGNTLLTVFGDDLSTYPTEGFEVGEELNFRMVNLLTLQEQDLKVQYDKTSPSPDKNFEVNGISIVKSIQLNPGYAGSFGNNQLSVYPNPTLGLVAIEGLPPFSQMQLFTAEGHQIITRNIETESYNLDLRNFESGVYLLRIVSPGGIFTKRIVLF